APDGSRALVNYTQNNHGSLVMSPLTNGTFSFGGEMSTGIGRVAVMQRGTRYLGFVLRNAGLNVGDITTFASGANVSKNGSISSENVAGAPGAQAAPSIAGNYVVYAPGASVVVVNTAQLGSAGAGGSSGLVV